MKQKFFLFLMVGLIACLLWGCGAETSQQGSAPSQETAQEPEQEETEQTQQEETSQQPMQETVPQEPEVSHVVVLDPGHQATGNSEQEPNGPGSSAMKAKVSSGTQGQFTGLAEYELNLQIGLQLEQELQNRGYTVYMTRTENEVDISNVERAEYASQVGGEILVRLHANGSTDSSVSGAMTICQTPNNPYQSVYTESRLLSDCILSAYCEATQIPMQSVWETDTMTGINWCQVPSTILEMGYMTNASDDENMANPEFQVKMVQGIADGIDAYFASIDTEKTGG